MPPDPAESALVHDRRLFDAALRHAFMMTALLVCVGGGAGCTDYSARVNGAPVLLFEGNDVCRFWHLSIEKHSPLDLLYPGDIPRFVKRPPQDLSNDRELSAIVKNTPILNSPEALVSIAQIVAFDRLYRDDYVILGNRPFLIALRGSRRPGADAEPKQPLEFGFVTEDDLSAQISELYVVHELSNRDAAKLLNNRSGSFSDRGPRPPLHHVPLNGTFTIADILNQRPWLSP